jgi:hypothetical protein
MLPSSNKKIIQKPAADLVKDGQVLEVGEATSLAESGFDLSNLNPVENKLWQNQSYPLGDADQQSYPPADRGVRFVSFEAKNYGTAMARVESLETPGTYFRIGISRFSQPVMMRAALLRKLGYFLPSPRYYSNLKLQFSTEEQKKDFLEEAQKYAGDFDSRKWIISDNPETHSVVLASSTLEVVSNDFFDIHWGFAPNPDDPRQKPLVQLLSKNRAYRALLLPYALVDVPESVNRYSARMILVQSGYAVIQQSSAKSFEACTYQDFRWLLKRMSKLTPKDYQDIVSEGHYPSEIEPLVLAKLLYRADETLKMFSLTSNIKLQPLDITSSSGLVKKGKVTQEFVPGYPQRFAHGDRTSPYNEGDFGRYLGVLFNSSVLGSLIEKANEYLQAQTIDDIAAKHQQDKIQSFLDWLSSGGRSEPTYQNVGFFGGPVGGLNLSATRNIATGAYSGSTAPVQLVDNVSVGATVGYFAGLDGMQNFFPMFQGNLRYIRDYTHVRPILSIKEGTKVSWTNVLVPQFMTSLSDVLKSEETSVTDSDGKVQQQKSLDKFLADLRVGEIFTISDSVALGVGIQTQSGLNALLGITPFNFLNSLTLGVDATAVILRQVSFARTSEGVQVFIREMKNKGAGLELNASYFLKLLKIRSQMQAADVNTEAFVIDYDPSIAAESSADSEQGQKFAKTRENLRAALHPLFKYNETEVLYSKFRNNKFLIQHKFNTQDTKLQILAFKWDAFKEEHLMTLQYPPSEEHPELDPKDEEVTLYSYKKGKLKGRDYIGMLFDVMDGIFGYKKQKITIARALGDNPANIPLGSAYWTQINTEADLTKNGKQYPSVAQVQHVWGGWSMSKAKFFNLVDEIENEFSGTELAPYRLINKESLLNMKSLDFYRITANLSILEGGVAKIQELLVQADAADKPVYRPSFFLFRFFQNLSQLGGNKARAEDPELFKDMMAILGNGDEKAGTDKYMEQCKAEQENRNNGVNGSHNSPTSTYVYGTLYDCMSEWLRKLIKYSRHIPEDKKEQTKWMTEVLEIMEERIPLAQLLKFLGPENYLFFIRVNGFRVGDEDGDLEYYSNTIGDPTKNYDYAGGLFQLYAKKTRIIPIEIDRTQGGFQ